MILSVKIIKFEFDFTTNGISICMLISDKLYWNSSTHMAACKAFCAGLQSRTRVELYKCRPYPEVVYSKKWGTKKGSFSKFEKVSSFPTTFCPFVRIPNRTARSLTSTIARYRKHTNTVWQTYTHQALSALCACSQLYMWVEVKMLMN